MTQTKEKVAGAKSPTKEKVVGEAMENPEASKDGGLEIDKDAKIETKASEKEIVDAKKLTAEDKNMIASLPRSGRFEIVQLPRDRVVLVNKTLQVVSPVAVSTQEQSDLFRMRQDMNMKDPEQKLINRKLKDTPNFGNVTESFGGGLDNPIVVPDGMRGNLNK